ncbi:MAG: alkaline phosphatase [Pseudomonadota bacterium]|nr:alkaline phosphatase [Pseudomonadota bacterium]
MKASYIALAATLAATPVLAQEVDLPQADSDWYKAGQARLDAELAQQPNTNTAKNVIIMIADGNGVATNYATRVFMGQQAGGYGDDYALPQEQFPSAGLVKTYNVNAQTPDSAGTGTAMMTGVKTDIGVLGVNANVNRGDCSTLPGNTVATASDVFADLGKEVGLVTTTRITHATPAAAYAHSVERDFEASVPEGCSTQKDIADQLLEAMKAGRIDVAMGGGRRSFLPADATGDEGDDGRRQDGRNLIDAAKKMGAAYAWNAATAADLPTDGSAPILGLFESSHMAYEADREDEPSLSEMTRIALKNLQAKAGDNGFFMQIEGGRVDHANHGTNLARAVTDGAEFARTVALVDEMTDDEDTLIIVTADHSHGLAFNGYCGRGSNILGLCMQVNNEGIEALDEPNLAADGKPYTAAVYGDGESSILAEGAPAGPDGGRPVVTQQEATALDYQQLALIPQDSESHSPADVAVYAKGPWSQLIDGQVEQNYLFNVMLHAATQ